MGKCNFSFDFSQRAVEKDEFYADVKDLFHGSL
jgi:hypothetical protein